MNNPFRCFNSSPEVIRLEVMLYIRYPLSLRQVEDILFERGIGDVTLSLDPGTASEITAAELESGASRLTGSLGDGSGKWRLEVESEQQIVAMSLLESPTDHLTNLSTVSPGAVDGKHTVPLFPAAGDGSGRQGFLRVVNRSETAGRVRITAFDETDRDYEPLMLSIGANEVVHFNSDDLEQGNAQKGLTAGTYQIEGDTLRRQWDVSLGPDIIGMESVAKVRGGGRPDVRGPAAAHRGVRARGAGDLSPAGIGSGATWPYPRKEPS